jgi:hypothetical protein
MTAGADALWDDIGFLAFNLHWSLNDLLDLPHGIRHQLVERTTVLARNGNTYG